MALRSDLEGEVKEIFKSAWSYRNGTVVPSEDSVALGNDGVKIDAVVLYADLADSTVLVESFSSEFAAEIYKTFCGQPRESYAAKVARSPRMTATVSWQSSLATQKIPPLPASA